MTALGFADGLEEHYQDFSEIMTRADFVGLCARLTGMVNDGYDSVFKDVIPGDYMENEINAASEMGLISRADTFMPEAPVTYEQICKIIVCLLGYDVMAEIESGYPIGYIKWANELDLTEEIAGKKEITKRDGLKVIYDVLFAEVLQQKGTDYEVIEGETLLALNFDIYIGEGIVQANEDTSLQVQNSSLGENQIMINDVVYYCGATSARDLLGLKCEFFYHNDDDTCTIKYIAEIQDENEVINILAADIESYSDKIFKYYDDEGKLKKKNISLSADVLYNGKAYPTYTDADLIPGCGEVVLIDNDDDRTIDVVFVYSHEDYYVSTINNTEYIITDKINNKTLKLPMDDSSISIRIIKDKNDIAFSEIQKDNVLTVFKSKNADKYLVYVSDVAVSGIISACEGTYDSNMASWNVSQPIIKINGMEYRVSLHFKENFRIGSRATVYINEYNEVVNVDYEDAYTFAYLLKATETEPGEDPVYYLKVVSQDDVICKYQLAKKVKINNNLYSTEKDGFSLSTEGIWNYGSELEENRKVIAYSLNSDNEINVLFTPVEGAPAENSLTYTVTSEKNSTFKGGSVNAFFKSYTDEQTGKKMYETHFLDDAPIMFNVPTDNSEDTLIRVIPLKRVRTDHSYAVEGFCFGEKGLTKVILKRVESGVSGDFTTNSMLITGINQVWQDDDVRMQISGLVSGTPTSITLDENVIGLDGITEGSVVMYNNPITDGDRITNIEVLFDNYSNKHTYQPSESSYGFNNSYRTHYGKVASIENGFVTFYDDHNQMTYKYRTDSTVVYVVEENAKRGVIYKADISDLTEEDDVFLSIKNEKLSELVIYK